MRPILPPRPFTLFDTENPPMNTTTCPDCGLEITGKSGTRITTDHREPCTHHPAHGLMERAKIVEVWNNWFQSTTDTWEDLALDLAYLWPAILEGSHIEVSEKSAIWQHLMENDVPEDSIIWDYVVNEDDPNIPTIEEQAEQDRQLIEQIEELLWPSDDPDAGADADWDSDTLGRLGNLLQEAGYGPKEEGQVREGAPDFIIDEPQGMTAYDICDECGASIPRTASSIINEHHAPSCSCHPDALHTVVVDEVVPQAMVRELNEFILKILQANDGYCLDNIAERASLARSLQMELTEFFNFSKK